jgi:hypothetical protein
MDRTMSASRHPFAPEFVGWDHYETQTCYG